MPCERSARRDLWSRPRAGGGAGAGGGRGLGAGRGPSPVTSCRAAGAGADLQGLRPRRPRQVRLPHSSDPPARRRQPSPRPLRLFPPAVPSSSPFFLPPSPSRRRRRDRRRPGPPAGGRAPGNSQVRRPGRAWRGPRGRRGRVRGEVGGGVGPRPRRARAPGLLPRASPSARGAFPEEAGPPAPPASGRRAAWTPAPHPLLGPETGATAPFLIPPGAPGCRSYSRGGGGGSPLEVLETRST